MTGEEKLARAKKDVCKRFQFHYGFAPRPSQIEPLETCENADGITYMLFLVGDREWSVDFEDARWRVNLEV